MRTAAHGVCTWGTDTPSELTGVMVTARVADSGGSGAQPQPGSGAGAPAGCGAEPREEKFDRFLRCFEQIVIKTFATTFLIEQSMLSALCHFSCCC